MHCQLQFFIGFVFNQFPCLHRCTVKPCIYLYVCACIVLCVGASACSSVLKFVEMAACLSGSVCLARTSSMWAENREAAFWSHHSPDSAKRHRGKHCTVREMFAEGYKLTFSKSSHKHRTPKAASSLLLYTAVLFRFTWLLIVSFSMFFLM